MLGEDSSRDADEQELIIAMYKTWKEVLGPSFDRQTS
jgi:hypothetical protein